MEERQFRAGLFHSLLSTYVCTLVVTFHKSRSECSVRSSYCSLDNYLSIRTRSTDGGSYALTLSKEWPVVKKRWCVVVARILQAFRIGITDLREQDIFSSQGIKCESANASGLAPHLSVLEPIPLLISISLSRRVLRAQKTNAWDTFCSILV